MNGIQLPKKKLYSPVKTAFYNKERGFSCRRPTLFNGAFAVFCQERGFSQDE